jgi:hypothetical protein
MVLFFRATTADSRYPCSATVCDGFDLRVGTKLGTALPERKQPIQPGPFHDCLLSRTEAILAHLLLGDDVR